jgi:hypothetical protein
MSTGIVLAALPEKAAVPHRTGVPPAQGSTDNMEYMGGNSMEPFICRDRTKHSEKPESAPRGRIPKDMIVVDRVCRKLKTKEGRRIYSKRKESVEAVLGQIKQAISGFRQFLLRGLESQAFCGQRETGAGQSSL